MAKTRQFGNPFTVTVIAVTVVVILAWLSRGRFEPVIIGTEAPEFSYPDLDGQPVSLSDYRGKVVLINIWATWCPPCRDEMPSMERLYQEIRAERAFDSDLYDGDDFEILAISMEAPFGQVDSMGRPGGDLRAFAEEMGLTFPILHDPEDRISRLYQTTGVPETFVIGRDGVIYRKIAGPSEWDAGDHVELIRRLLSDG